MTADEKEQMIDLFLDCIQKMPKAQLEREIKECGIKGELLMRDILKCELSNRRKEKQ